MPSRADQLQVLVDEGKLLWDVDLDVSRDYDATWAGHYARLVAYGEEAGTCNVPGSVPGLGQWLSDQRKMKRRGKLLPDREAQLQILVDQGKLLWDMGHVPTRDDATWARHFDLLVAYGDEHGDCNIPYNYPVMGPWLRYQRFARRRGILLPDRVFKLQALVDAGKLAWDLGHESSREDSWESHFAGLLAYGEENGHCDVPKTVPGLGQWLRSQRCRKRKNELLPEREAQLQELVDQGKLHWDMVSEISRSDTWQHHFDLLVAYGEQHGHCNVSEPGPLMDWLRAQRMAKRKSRMKPERHQLLQALVDEGKLKWVDWSKDDETWSNHYHDLVAYGSEHGHCNVPNSHSGLGGWLRSQRHLRKANKLEPGREALLQQLVDRGQLLWEINVTRPRAK